MLLLVTWLLVTFTLLDYSYLITLYFYSLLDYSLFYSLLYCSLVLLSFHLLFFELQDPPVSFGTNLFRNIGFETCSLWDLASVLCATRPHPWSQGPPRPLSRWWTNSPKWRLCTRARITAGQLCSVSKAFWQVCWGSQKSIGQNDCLLATSCLWGSHHSYGVWVPSEDSRPLWLCREIYACWLIKGGLWVSVKLALLFMFWLHIFMICHIPPTNMWLGTSENLKKRTSFIPSCHFAEEPAIWGVVVQLSGRQIVTQKTLIAFAFRCLRYIFVSMSVEAKKSGKWKKRVMWCCGLGEGFDLQKSTQHWPCISRCQNT